MGKRSQMTLLSLRTWGHDQNDTYCWWTNNDTFSLLVLPMCFMMKQFKSSYVYDSIVLSLFCTISRHIIAQKVARTLFGQFIREAPIFFAIGQIIILSLLCKLSYDCFFTTSSILILSFIGNVQTKLKNSSFTRKL